MKHGFFSPRKKGSILKYTGLILCASLLLAYIFIPAESRNLLLEKKKLSIAEQKDDTAPSDTAAPASTGMAAPGSGTELQPEPPAIPAAAPGGSDTLAETPWDAGPAPTPQEEAGDELNQYLESKEFFSYSRERWLKMRRVQEGEERPEEKKKEGEGVEVSTSARPSPPPLPPGLSLELPYESQLSISGRKLIGVSWKSTIYDQPETGKRVNTNSIDMTQELQVRIKGRVGRKINVNVDFDDTTPDKRDISVVYKGDPDEVVQEAAFGDISMSLPSTEFVGYSRQLFGVKMDAKYKKLRTWGFFSRTKGLSEVKRFTGNTKFEPKTIPDTSYLPYKYYLLGFKGEKIVNGTVKVYRDDRIQSNDHVNIASNTVVATYQTPTIKTYKGNFDLLVAGQDYTIDYNRNLIIFKYTLASNAVIAIDYQKDSDKSWLRDNDPAYPNTWKIIKDENNDPAITQELKLFYPLGNVKIIRDNGRGNFLLQVRDLNKNTPVAFEPGKTLPVYDSGIEVDFESGIFNFKPLMDGQGRPSKPLHDDLYNANRTHKYDIYTEYRYRIKFVTLRAGIVPQSERVTMDGRTMQRDVDYYIDYDAGLVTFFDENKINEGTVIEVSYDYAPFGGTGGSTLIGLRSELSLTNNIFIGGSFIYDFSAKTQTVPDIRSAPSSLMVSETDFRVQNIQIPGTPLSMSVGAEVAKSDRNPNIMGKAVLENMEGIKQEDSVSLFRENWQVAATPSGQRFYMRNKDLSSTDNDISWNNEDVSKKNINPSISVTESDEKQQVLSVNYNLQNSSQVSIAQVLSTTGLDYSRKQYLEMWVHGDGQNAELLVGYGGFNEDADGDGIFEREDINNDGVLNSGEDNGLVFHNPDLTNVVLGAGNDLLNTEDLDRNGNLDAFDEPTNPSAYGMAPGDTALTTKSMTDTDNVAHTSIDWVGWKLLKVPLNITIPQDWQAIQQVRITIQGRNRQTGNIKIANISAVGNRWESAANQPVVAGSTLTVSALNTDDPRYSGRSLLDESAYKDLYETHDIDKSRQKEQALSLNYSVIPSTYPVELSTRLLYTRPYDLSNYKHFKMFVYGNGRNEDAFFIQAGNDANYFEYTIPLGWSGWKVITITQRDINGDSKPDVWALNDAGDMEDNSMHNDFTVIRTTVVGAPSLQNISQIKMGVRAKGPKTNEEVLVDDIHMTDAWTKTGYAWRGNLDVAWPKWGTFGGKRKEIDRNFETFSAGVYNRDYLEDSAYLNIDRIPFMPITSSLNRTRTVTPAIIATDSDLLSTLEEGRVTTYTGTGGTSLNPIDPLQSLVNTLFGTNYNLSRFFPRLGGQYNRSITDSQQIDRLEDRESYSSTLDYTNPLDMIPILPKSISANYSLSNSYFRVYPSTRIVDTDDFLDVDSFRKYLELKDYHTLEVTESFGVRSPFQFWSGFHFSPTYSLKTVKEKNNQLQMKYDKSADQNVGFNSSLRIFPWLQPGLSYSINTAESYNPYATAGSTPTLPGQVKHIDRSSTGELTWNFQVKDFIEFPYTQSLGFSSSYRRQDSDSYDNVEGSYTVVGVLDSSKLWIRGNPLTPGNTSQYIVKSIVQKDDVRVAGRYNPFEAFIFPDRLSPLRTLSANFTYTASEAHETITGTKSDIYTKIWPDLLFTINQVEKMMWLERWLSDCQVNVKHQLKLSETVGALRSESTMYGGDLRFNALRKLDLNFSITSTKNNDFDLKSGIEKLSQAGNNLAWSLQVGFNIRKWRCTLRYEDTANSQEDGAGKLTSDSQTRTYTGQFYSDISFPQGLPIPFTGRTLPLTNRMIFNGNVKYATTRSRYDQNNNTNNYGLSLNIDYEVSQNFRFALGAGYNRYEKAYRPPDAANEDYSTIELNSKLTIQF